MLSAVAAVITSYLVQPVKQYDPAEDKRGPALYISGRPGDGAGAWYTFRLPPPPSWDDRPLGAWAAERRAKKAYFAVLDAMRTGVISPLQMQKLGRLIDEVRSRSARLALTQLERVWQAVSRYGAESPLLPPPTRMVELTATVVRVSTAAHVNLQSRFAWSLEWLRTRGYLAAGADELMDWRLEGVPGQLASSEG